MKYVINVLQAEDFANGGWISIGKKIYLNQILRRYDLILFRSTRVLSHPFPNSGFFTSHKIKTFYHVKFWIDYRIPTSMKP